MAEPTTADLISDLRAWSWRTSGDLHTQAADRLAELEAEVERLREANFILTQSENADTALAEIALAAERALNDELADVVAELVDPNTCTCWSPDDRHCKGHAALARHAEARK